MGSLGGGSDADSTKEGEKRGDFVRLDVAFDALPVRGFPVVVPHRDSEAGQFFRTLQRASRTAKRAASDVPELSLLFDVDTHTRGVVRTTLEVRGLIIHGAFGDPILIQRWVAGEALTPKIEKYGGPMCTHCACLGQVLHAFRDAAIDIEKRWGAESDRQKSRLKPSATICMGHGVSVVWRVSPPHADLRRAAAVSDSD